MNRSEALRLRDIIEQSVQLLSDETALTAVCLHPMWASDVSYAAGFKVQRIDKLWRCIQAHTSRVSWEPENAASLWEQINETHSGTEEDPIPYSGNMALTAGMYYIQSGIVYRCTRDTINPVYNPLTELVGLYVEVI